MYLEYGSCFKFFTALFATQCYSAIKKWSIADVQAAGTNEFLYKNWNQNYKMLCKHSSASYS